MQMDRCSGKEHSDERDSENGMERQVKDNQQQHATGSNAHFTGCISYMVECMFKKVLACHYIHLVAMSSSSPPQPQYWFGKPFILRY